jgi:hypothetical protein
VARTRRTPSSRPIARTPRSHVLLYLIIRSALMVQHAELGPLRRIFVNASQCHTYIQSAEIGRDVESRRSQTKVVARHVRISSRSLARSLVAQSNSIRPQGWDGDRYRTQRRQERAGRDPHIAREKLTRVDGRLQVGLTLFCTFTSLDFALPLSRGRQNSWGEAVLRRLVIRLDFKCSVCLDTGILIIEETCHALMAVFVISKAVFMTRKSI